MSMDTVAREWLAARNIIASFLRELAPAWPTETIEHNAAAILARLASHDLLIHTADDDALTEAAPDLLAACKSWIAFMDKLDADSDPDDRVAIVRRAFHGKRVDATRAAIVKAEGRAS